MFLPFPTTLVAVASDDALSRLLYIGTMAVSSALLALLARVSGRDRELRDTDAEPDPRVAAGSTVAFMLALATSLAFPATGYWPLLRLLVTNPLIAWLRRQ